MDRFFLLCFAALAAGGLSIYTDGFDGAVFAMMCFVVALVFHELSQHDKDFPT